ncbi:MAG: SOS response-associated peptidase [Caldilineaceae bacterium SB0666_bin_21]|nr:SOS response-associated peptidase [Caldilineaceae bacterium SB0666_bin_21]
MCGRFGLIPKQASFQLQFAVDLPQGIVPQFNIAPTQPVAIVRRNTVLEDRESTFAHWGLIPGWSKDASWAARLINARSETAAEKPSFRSAFKRRRCLIPATFFYEWTREKGGRQPYRFAMADGSYVAMAGLWEHWQSPDGHEIESCTILTTDANEFMQTYHHRMPVILHPRQYDMWLMADEWAVPGLRDLCQACPDDVLDVQPASRLVNDAGNEGPHLLDAE